MKTRIRKIEYSNGKIEYVCEKSKFPETAIVLFIISLICLIAFFYFLNLSKIFCSIYIISSFLFLFISAVIYRDRWRMISYKINHNKRNFKSIFNNLDDAKKFINEELKKEADSKLKKKIKRETIIKFP